MTREIHDPDRDRTRAIVLPSDEERVEADAAPSALSRRSFLGSAASAAAVGATGVLLPSIAGSNVADAQAPGAASLSGAARRKAAYQQRVDAARFQLHLPIPGHPNNGDETRYSNRIGNFSKGLPHDANGEVDPAAYMSLLRAVDSGDPADFEAIIHGAPNPADRLKLVNPQAGIAFDLEGTDSHQFAQPAAPRFDSAEEAGEIVENYWMALLRDLPFIDYGMNPLVQTALADLSALSDFRGPKVGGQVTLQTLFRAPFPGCLDGPFLSQFFWLAQPYGAQFIENRARTSAPGVDFLTQPAEWLSVQNGVKPASALAFDPQLRYLRNGRDLGQWVHIDVLFQAYFQAAMTMMTPPDPSNPFTGGGIGAPVNPGNPYLGSLVQDGFGTFGGPHFATILCEVATRALKAVWYQKWFVHRRLRPEEFAGAVHQVVANGQPYPVHPDVLDSQALAEVFSRNGTYFLPMAFPEGCPIHPAYGAGHATVAGACVTILKALFDESFVISNPVVPTSDGLALVPYTGPSLTLGGELNKLAANVAFGRNIAGVHWRTDGVESMRLGEAVALSVLRDQRACYNEPFDGFTFTRFDGTPVTV